MTNTDACKTPIETAGIKTSEFLSKAAIISIKNKTNTKTSYSLKQSYNAGACTAYTTTSQHGHILEGWRLYESRVSACAQRTSAATRESLRRVASTGSRCLRSTPAVAPVLFAHAVITVARNRTSANPSYVIGVYQALHMIVVPLHHAQYQRS
jgi:hypothetical protein